MGISDWSSDVCSSDLIARHLEDRVLEGVGIERAGIGYVTAEDEGARIEGPGIGSGERGLVVRRARQVTTAKVFGDGRRFREVHGAAEIARLGVQVGVVGRSEARSVGKEGGRTC